EPVLIAAQRLLEPSVKRDRLERALVVDYQLIQHDGSERHRRTLRHPPPTITPARGQCPTAGVASAGLVGSMNRSTRRLRARALSLSAVSAGSVSANPAMKIRLLSMPWVMRN